MNIDRPPKGHRRPGPRLFLDSADPAVWQDLLPTGIFHGVTTNPLLLERAGQPCTVANLGRLAGLAREFGLQEIQIQTWGPSVEAMTGTGKILADLGQHGLRVVVKIPATPAGFQVARQLREGDHPVTLTAVYEPAQVLAAAALGAEYAAPYLGRLDDAGRDGSQLIGTMGAILRNTRAATRLLVASLRSAAQVVALAETGLDTFTFGLPVAQEILAGDMTQQAAADFQRAAESMKEDA